ncbi:MAG: trigger factor, partial [Kiritimatiellae bacterium]|nr:trigger factor [Kiritimatiellia bacterium]
RLAYILDAIADAEGIEVSDDTVKETIEKMIASAPAEKRSASEIIGDLGKSGRLEGFRSQIRAEKALDLAVESAK